MKIERLREYVTVIVTIIVGMLFSVCMGVAAGSGSRTPLMVIGGILAITVALVMQARIWILIPLLWPLAGQLYGFPGNFPLHDLVVIYVFCVFLVLKALKVIRTKPKYDWLDYLLWLNLFILAMAFVRHPIGTNSIGAERIGGRPYVEVLIAALGYWVLHHVTISKKLAPKMPFVLIAGCLFNLLLGIAAHLFPFVANTIGKFYAGAYVGPPPTDAVPDGEQRETYMSESSNLLSGLFSVFPPFSLLNPFHFFRFVAFILCLVALLKSGFRSMLLGVSLFFCLAVYFRNGKFAVIRFLTLCSIAVMLLAAVQGNIVNLPNNIQRTLSFLPGKWDPDVVREARGSTEWRHEIWSNVWTSGHKYINDWWFGDGFGMTRQQLNEALAYKDQGQENLTIAGAYHSLPLTAIHIVGYVGFFFFLILIFATLYYSWKLIIASRATPYYSAAILIGIPLIYAPFPALILTGFYDVHIIGITLGIGNLRLIKRSLEKYLELQKSNLSEQKTTKAYLNGPPFPRALPSHNFE